MGIEDGKLFVPPTTLYRDLPAEHLSGFRDLQRMQYDFDEGILDQNMLLLQKINYWTQLKDRVLSVVTNLTHPRLRQIGFALGYSPTGVTHIFGDKGIESLSDTEILVIEKSQVGPDAGIRVQVLDEDWVTILEEGLVVGYEPNPDNQQLPRASFLLDINGDIRRHPDWGGFDNGRVRFDVPNIVTYSKS